MHKVNINVHKLAWHFYIIKVASFGWWVRKLGLEWNWNWCPTKYQTSIYLTWTTCHHANRYAMSLPNQSCWTVPPLLCWAGKCQSYCSTNTNQLFRNELNQFEEYNIFDFQMKWFYIEENICNRWKVFINWDHCVPKSVPRLVLDKVRFCMFRSEVLNFSVYVWN